MILVTGATGTIGSEVVRQLVGRGQPLRALVRSPEKAMAAFGEAVGSGKVDLARGDLDDVASLDAALKGADSVLLLSSAGPTQVEQQSNLIQAAKRAGVKHIVKVSALGASKTAKPALGRWHAATEDELKASGITYTILQPHSFMQNLLMSAGSIRDQGQFYGAAKEGKIAVIDTRDIAAVAAAVLAEPTPHQGQTYVLTGGEALSNAEMAQKIAEATGKEVSYVDVPGEGLKTGMVGAGVPDWLADDLVAMNEAFAAGYGAEVSGVVEKVTHVKPRTFAQFAADFAQAFGGAAAGGGAGDDDGNGAQAASDSADHDHAPAGDEAEEAASSAAKHAASGDEAEAPDSSDEAKHAAGDDEAKHAAGDEEAKHAAGDDEAKQAASGDEAEQAADANEEKHAASGDEAEQAADANEEKHAAGANEAKHAASDDEAKQAASDEAAQEAAAEANASDGDDQAGGAAHQAEPPPGEG